MWRKCRKTLTLRNTYDLLFSRLFLFKPNNRRFSSRGKKKKLLEGHFFNSSSRLSFPWVPNKPLHVKGIRDLSKQMFFQLPIQIVEMISFNFLSMTNSKSKHMVRFSCMKMMKKITVVTFLQFSLVFSYLEKLKDFTTSIFPPRNTFLQNTYSSCKALCQQNTYEKINFLFV